jgi:hypothetical protein
MSRRAAAAATAVVAMPSPRPLALQLACLRAFAPAAARAHGRRRLHAAAAAAAAREGGGDAPAAAARLEALFARGPALTLERATAGRAGEDAALWATGRFAAQVHPDLPVASTWLELLRKAQRGGAAAAEAAAAPPPPPASPSGAWTVRTVAAQCRPRADLAARVRAAGAAADALLFVSGSHPARRLPLAASLLQGSDGLLRAAAAARAAGALPAALSLWAVADLARPADALLRKADAGAEVVLTQPPFLQGPSAAWFAAAERSGAAARVRLLAGVPVASSAANLDFWLRLAGVRGAPGAEALLAAFPRPGGGGDDAAHAAAVRRWNAAFVRRALALPGVAGLHVMPLTQAARALTLEFLADGTLPAP